MHGMSAPLTATVMYGVSQILVAVGAELVAITGDLGVVFSIFAENFTRYKSRRATR